MKETNKSIGVADGEADILIDHDIQRGSQAGCDNSFELSSSIESSKKPPHRESQRWESKYWVIGIVGGVALLYLLALLTWRLPKNLAQLENIHRHHGDESPVGEEQIAILLHPEEHIFRRPQHITYNWTISKGIRAPDGVEKTVYLVNGKFPGPVIECRSSDTLIINVENALDDDEGLALHWHGLHMQGFNDMDGAVGFTQDPIPSKDTFTYEFVIDENQHGTFWWHGHSQVQRGDGLFGGLIVHKPRISITEEESVQEEVLIVISDWYHRSAMEVLGWYESVRAFGNEPVPDSLLINGVGRFDCSMAVPARPINCTTILDTELQPLFSVRESNVRVRMINAGSMAGITIHLSNAIIMPIDVDGGFEIAGSRSDSLGVLYPGERVDFILEWNYPSQVSESVFTIILDNENFKYSNPSLKATQSFPALPSSSLPITPRSLSLLNTFNLSSAVALHQPSAFIPSYPAHQLPLYTKTVILSKNANHPQSLINRTSFIPQTPPLISLPYASYNEHQLIPRITAGSWIDIIVNNLDEGSHPFHLHGHDFWIVERSRSERGWGSWKWEDINIDGRDGGRYDLSKAVRKDTIMVPRRGYVVLRVRFDNLGVWMFHCHLLVHQATGMAMGFLVE